LKRLIGRVVAAILAPVSASLASAQGEDFARVHPSWATRWPVLFRAETANREMLVWAIMQLAKAVPFVAAVFRPRHAP